MEILRQKLDEQLLDLAWSIWTELGVAGIERKHQKFLIMPEELILLTVVLAKIDPRLRDEALDWCTRNHSYISISRLRTLIKTIGTFINEPFSLFAATLNSVSRANWPVLTKVSPQKFVPSKKSSPPNFENPSMLLFRLRALFGVGARADLLLFFLIHPKHNLAISDTVEIGYTKRTLAEVLDNFVKAGIFSVIAVRNQQRYSFIKQDPIAKILSPLPELMPSWWLWVEVILKLHDCIHRIEKKSIATKTVEINNVLTELKHKLKKLNLTLPSVQADLSSFLDSFSKWILKSRP